MVARSEAAVLAGGRRRHEEGLVGDSLCAVSPGAYHSMDAAGSATGLHNKILKNIYQLGLSATVKS